MRRSTLTLLIALFVGSAYARAGGPPPMYVVVDKVVLEPNGSTPDRIQIWGSFIRTEGRKNYDYGKPAYGYVYLSAAEGKQEACRAEWAKWKKAVGSGKAVAVGSCGEAGSLLKAPIHKPDDRPDKADAVYTPGHLEAFGDMYARGEYDNDKPVLDLLAFDKQRQQEAAKSSADRPRR